jgi:TPR repeat protein
MRSRLQALLGLVFIGSSLYADKPSQLSIGFLYLNGEGVEKDPVTALAWFELASERGYPMYVATSRWEIGRSAPP